MRVQWQSLRDGYPPVSRHVWVTVRYTGMIDDVLKGYWDGFSWRLTDGRYMRGEVTHWALHETPEPPA